MEDLLKKFLYTGVGIAALTAEKLQEAVDELVGKGKVSKEEGRKIVDDFVDQVNTKRDEWEEKLKETADKVSTRLRIPKYMTEEEFEKLVQRIEALEAKLDSSVVTEAEVKEVVKKTASKSKKSTK